MNDGTSADAGRPRHRISRRAALKWTGFGAGGVLATTIAGVGLHDLLSDPQAELRKSETLPTPPALPAPPAIRVISPSPGGTVAGTIQLIAMVHGITPDYVLIQIGATAVRATEEVRPGVWQATLPWDTTSKILDPQTDAPSNALYWIRAIARAQGVRHESEWVTATTHNIHFGALAVGGWRPSLAWAADYSSKEAWNDSLSSSAIGSAYATLVPDPVPAPGRAEAGADRKMIRAGVPDSARRDADQPTRSPRFQASSPIALREGDEFYVGWSIFVDEGFPPVFVADAGVGHIAIFQLYGGPYLPGRGAMTIIDAERTSDSDPVDVFQMTGNQMNPGDPGPVFRFPCNRGGWTDIVLGFHLSADVTKGWIEVYLNQGEHSSVQPVTLFGGLTRLPRTLLWPNSTAHRTDMQIYRSPTAYDAVTLSHTAHRIGQTVASVDPKSYPGGSPATAHQMPR